MTSNVPTFGNKWLSILLVIVTLSNPSSMTEKPPTEYCEKYVNYKDYEKVCGTDGITYSNVYHLECINRQDKTDVAVLHMGCCLPGEKILEHNDDFYIYSPVCTPDDGKTWSNILALRCHYHMHNITNERYREGSCSDDKDENPCIKHGFEYTEVNPVCANNGFTYQNLQQVKCLKKNNPRLRVAFDGNCRVPTVVKYLDPSFERTLKFRSETIQFFCEMSRNRFELNPICGTDNVTYDNPFAFLCKRGNNENLTVAFQGVCDSDIHKECLRAGMNYNKRIGGETLKPVKSKPEDAVCANNGKIYRNIHELRCRAKYDKNLSLKVGRACLGPKENPCGAISCEGSDFPVCASNNVTYISIEAMWCINRRKRLSSEYEMNLMIAVDKEVSAVEKISRRIKKLKDITNSSDSDKNQVDTASSSDEKVTGRNSNSDSDSVERRRSDGMDIPMKNISSFIYVNSMTNNYLSTLRASAPISLEDKRKGFAPIAQEESSQLDIEQASISTATPNNVTENPNEKPKATIALPSVERIKAPNGEDSSPTKKNPENCGWELIDGKYHYYWVDGPHSPSLGELSSDIEESEDINSDDCDEDEEFLKTKNGTRETF
ncbi:hypothetical protein PV325_012910 [Microctonus aethiopoides]|nr:hypothetical protein PV325_012910 [Microctonus aethiopoides]